MWFLIVSWTAMANIQGFENKQIKGKVYFKQLEDRTVVIEGKIEGLKPNKTYAIHVHEYGDCSSPKASGGHFDPYMTKKHGHPNDPIGIHHSGDLPNIKADGKGVAKVEFKTKAFTVEPSIYSVLGRAVIIHENPDDYTSQPAGNAGKRIACGVIGNVKEERK